MSRPAAAPGVDRQRRAIRLTLVAGVLLCVPRLVLAWFLLPSSYEIPQLIGSLLLFAGLVTIGVGLFRILWMRTGRLLPLAIGGAAAVVLAGVLTRLQPPEGAAIAYSGGVLTPPDIVAYQYFWTVVGAVWQVGFVFVAGALLMGTTRYRAARAGR